MYLLAYEVLVFHAKVFVDQMYKDNPQLKRTRYVTENVKSSYMNGFLLGLEERFAEQVSALRQVYELLVLVPEAVELAYHDYTQGWSKSSLRTPAIEISAAYQKGYVEGKGIDFTKRTVAEKNG